MPSSALKIAVALRGDRTKFGILRLIDKVLPIALEAAKSGRTSISRNISFLDYRLHKLSVETLILVPPSDCLDSINYMIEKGILLFNKSEMTINGKHRLTSLTEEELKDKKTKSN